jgi:hypothetical protein
MKTLLALSCATACLLFVGCSGGESDDVALEQKDIRPVGETVAALLAQRRAEGCVNVEARATLTRIADAEAQHAALAWRFVAWAIAQGGAAVRDAAREAFTEALAGLDGPGGAPCSVDDATWRAHGLATIEDQRAALASARRDVLVPCAAALLGPLQKRGRNDGLRATI